MKQALISKIKHLLILESASLTDALKQMDKIDKKLLIVVDSEYQFKSIVSVGDIQRNLIKNQNFNAAVKNVLRQHIKTAKKGQELAEIKKQMLKFRMEFMPVLTTTNSLVDVLFWEDFFQDKHSSATGNLNLPVVIMARG